VRIALLTEGGYPYARGEAVVWCDRLLRGLGGHEFEVYALSRSARQESGRRCELPGNVRRVRTAPLWDSAAGRGSADMRAGSSRPYGRRERRRFGECFGELAAAVCGAGHGAVTGAGPAAGAGEDAAGAGQLADRFAAGLYGLAELARDCGGGLRAALRSELAVRILQSACRAPGTLRAVHSAQVTDLLAVSERLERALRPLSLDWYGGGDGESADTAHGLAGVDLCHAVGGGPAALPGLLAKRFFGTPLLITEYGVRVREHYLASAADAVAPAAAGAPVRALLASFQRQLTREAYTRAQLITPGNTHSRRWQERCGAPREKLRTVYPGMDAAPFAELGEEAGCRTSGDRTAADDATLVWAGRIEPAKDLIGLLHAFAEVRQAVAGARLRIVATAPGRGPEACEYESRCRALAAQLFPDEAADAVAVGENPVSFEELGAPSVPTPADAYGAGCVVVLSSSVEGFPVPLVEAMFSGRATVSTDVGAVCEVIGGTGLVVPSRNPRALADGCIALLRDPERRERLGAAARARALELFTVEQNVAAFRAIYLELMSRWPTGACNAAAVGDGQEPLPFARPPESHVPGRWAGGPPGGAGGGPGGGGAGQPLPGVCTPTALAPLARSASSVRAALLSAAHAGREHRKGEGR
jgi:glycosyltransferase involved in cell wall biosynthesis